MSRGGFRGSNLQEGVAHFLECLAYFCQKGGVSSLET